MITLSFFQEKMKSPVFRFLLNIALAVLIFLGAELGGILGLKGGGLAISVVWPSTGIALAALLLFGYRSWSGIFLGNLAFNSWFLHLNNQAIVEPLVLGSIVALGSLLQALLAVFIIRRYNSLNYFFTVKDIYIFLIPAGVLACIVASTIGITALYSFGQIPWPGEWYTWMTFWLGDSMGVFIFTPLLVVWAIQKPQVSWISHVWECLLMVASFAAISFFVLVKSLPVEHLYIPLCVWVTYRFRMHGATLATFLITAVMILPIYFGYGPFIGTAMSDILPVLVSFLMITVATSLILAAVINERQLAWDVLKNHNIELLEVLTTQDIELKSMSQEEFMKDKLTALSGLTAGITKNIRVPLRKGYTKAQYGLDCVKRLQKILSSYTEEPESDLQAQIEHLNDMFQHIIVCGRQADRIAKILEEQTKHLTDDGKGVKALNLNVILNMCLSELENTYVKLYPDFKFTLIKEFDRKMKMIMAAPDDLIHSFTYLFNNALFSMHEKRILLGHHYEPILEVRTTDHDDCIEVVIWDNGIGIPGKHQKYFFHSFMTSRPFREHTDRGLSIAHNIVVHVYKGKIRVSSKEGEFLQINLVIPKSRT